MNLIDYINIGLYSETLSKNDEDYKSYKVFSIKLTNFLFYENLLWKNLIGYYKIGMWFGTLLGNVRNYKRYKIFSEKRTNFVFYGNLLLERNRLPRGGNLWSSRLETCARIFLYPYPEIGFFTVKSVTMDELTPKFDMCNKTEKAMRVFAKLTKVSTL